MARLAPWLPAQTVKYEEHVQRESHPYQPVFRFARGTTRLVPDPSSLDEMAALLKHPDPKLVFLHGTVESGEARTSKLRGALAHRRVQVIVDELTRRGIPRERLIEQDEREFVLTRNDLSAQEARTLLDAAAVLIYVSPSQTIETLERRSAPCLPGVNAVVEVPPNEFSAHLESILTLRTCLDGRCAQVGLSLATLWFGDELIVQLDGEHRASATLAWLPTSVRVVVRTVADEPLLRNGASYELALGMNGQRFRTLSTLLEFGTLSDKPGACRVAELHSH